VKINFLCAFSNIVIAKETSIGIIIAMNFCKVKIFIVKILQIIIKVIICEIQALKMLRNRKLRNKDKILKKRANFNQDYYAKSVSFKIGIWAIKSALMINFNK
jgi:hypothetical protein